MKISAPRFDLYECNSDAESEFIEALHARAEAGGWSADSWLRDDRIIITVDLDDPQFNCILQMLRIDFDGTTVIVGFDETMQLATDLDPKRVDVIQFDNESPAVLANATADWLEREMARPIERHEWNTGAFRCTRWLYADTQKGLVESDSQNKKRTNLGPSDKVVKARSCVSCRCKRRR